MPKQSDSRKRMLRSMSALMRKKGYSGTGLSEIIAASGAPKGSIYFHFPGGKEQLAADAIVSSGSAIQRIIATTLRAAPDAPSAVRYLTTGMAGALAASGYSDGCPIATVALEAAITSDAITRSSAEAFRSWEEAIKDRFVEFGWPEPQATEAATLILCALEGGLLLSRVYRSPAPLEAVGRQLATYVAGPNTS